jgi:hypothetical protein
MFQSAASGGGWLCEECDREQKQGHRLPPRSEDRAHHREGRDQYPPLIAM